MKEDYKISKVKHQWGKSQRDMMLEELQDT